MIYIFSQMNKKDKKNNIKQFLTQNNFQIATVMYQNQKVTLFDYLRNECEYSIESCLVEELIDDIENNLFNNGKKIPFTQKRYTVKWNKILGLRNKTEEQEEQIETEPLNKKCKFPK